MACSTAGLIPDALLGVQGAAFVCLPIPAFVCLPIPGVLDLLSYLPPCPFPTQSSSWYRGDVQLGWVAMPTPSEGQKCKSFFLFIS